MSIDILSLDLDWFNTYSEEGFDIRKQISHFFRMLKKECVLPKTIYLVPEHQYFYPWSVNLLRKKLAKKMNVINIDQHHDFYCLNEISNFDGPNEIIGCWNFFAFMAHKGLIDKYVWVTNEWKDYNYETLDVDDLFWNIDIAKSTSINNFKKCISVFKIDSVFNVIKNKKFDGFMIIRSPAYTLKYRSVYSVLDKILKEELPQIKVHRYKCRANFKNKLVPQQMKLFVKV